MIVFCTYFKRFEKDFNGVAKPRDQITTKTIWLNIKTPSWFSCSGVQRRVDKRRVLARTATRRLESAYDRQYEEERRQINVLGSSFTKTLSKTARNSWVQEENNSSLNPEKRKRINFEDAG